MDRAIIGATPATDTATKHIRDIVSMVIEQLVFVPSLESRVLIGARIMSGRLPGKAPKEAGIP